MFPVYIGFSTGKNFHIKGKVSGSEWSSVAPLINAYIQIKEKPETGFLTDSLGNFKIDRLKKGNTISPFLLSDSKAVTRLSALPTNPSTT